MCDTHQALKKKLSHQLQSNDAKKGMLQKFWDAASSYREQHPGESPVLGFATIEPPTRSKARWDPVTSAYACYVDDNLLSRSCFTLIRLERGPIRSACRNLNFIYLL